MQQGLPVLQRRLFKRDVEKQENSRRCSGSPGSVVPPLALLSILWLTVAQNCRFLGLERGNLDGLPAPRPSMSRSMRVWSPGLRTVSPPGKAFRVVQTSLMASLRKMY